MRRPKDPFQRYQEVVARNASRKTKAEIRAQELCAIGFIGLDPDLRPASSQLPQIRNTCQDNITAFWAATDDMDKETELGYRIRTKSLSSNFEKYMDTDDLEIPMATESRVEFERRFSCKIGVRCYLKYQKAFQEMKEPWVCGQCGIFVLATNQKPEYTYLEKMGVD